MAAYRAPAADTPAKATTAKPDKTYTGTVVAVDPNGRMLEVKGFLFSKKFNLGDSCTYTIVGKDTGTLGDLRSGQRVTVGYQDANGVLIADRVTQRPLCEEGMVKAINPAAHTLTLHLRTMDKAFRLPDDCAIVLRGGKSGTLADIQTGDHVTVTYEIPNDKPTVRQIAQTSETFTGSLTAVDMNDRTVKAKTLFGAKTFHLGDHCAIVVNGQPGGQMTDLKLGSRMEFSYDDVNGVSVANRIGPATTPAETETTSAQPTTKP